MLDPVGESGERAKSNAFLLYLSNPSARSICDPTISVTAVPRHSGTGTASTTRMGTLENISKMATKVSF